MNRIPFYSLHPQHRQIRSELLEAIGRVIDSDSFILGSRLAEFESAYATFSGCRFSTGVASGFDALELSLRALGIGKGDEVIVPAQTFIATWLAVSNTGAQPIPVEPDEATMNMDASKISDVITSRTKAVMPVHLFGLPCDMTSIMEVARRHHLFVVEDNAQAHGAMYKGRPTGSFGDINATSFYPTKNLGAMGDGGAITTNDSDLDATVRMLRNYGSLEKNTNKVPGVNSRLDEMHAAILTVKLKFLADWTNQRAQIANRYIEELKDTGDMILPSAYDGCTHVYHRFVVRTAKRDQLKSYLEENGIDTMVHYPVPPHLQAAYTGLGYQKGTFPTAEKHAASGLSLPLWPGMSEDQVAQVISRIRNYWK